VKHRPDESLRELYEFAITTRSYGTGALVKALLDVALFNEMPPTDVPRFVALELAKHLARKEQEEIARIMASPPTVFALPKPEPATQSPKEKETPHE